ncbi:LPP20 family lipoprotein [Psychromonas sp. CD1]|uniref:LPP20 family lipoprotein n=1 Tax=Psychromonas sp. CD1 TaxID=1979839 RepID=UPI0015D9DE49|nr:LPP20 family lipoprotein [Psychromonas sp. CD1]
MKYISSYILLISCFLLSACASDPQTKSRPQWVNQPSAVYASDQYLSAVGQASNLERARQNALANLSDVFSVKIHVQSDMLTQANKQETPLGVTMQSKIALQRQIATESEHTLKGVMIKESWQSSGGEYYAVALLEKYKAAQSLTESIDALDEQSRSLIDYSLQDAPNSIASLHALSKARDLQLAREVANEQLQQVRLSGVPMLISSAKIEQMMAKKLATLKVSVQQPDKQQQKLITSALAELGMRVVVDADINVSADLSLNTPIYTNSWYWLHASYQLSFVENGQVISRKRWPIKISAKQSSLLQSRLDNYLSEHIKTYVSELMSSLPAL